LHGIFQGLQKLVVLALQLRNTLLGGDEIPVAN
jgi:hypothetical protein